MISLVVYMTSAQQWAVGLLIPTVITLGGNWGLSKFNDGSESKRLESLEAQVREANLPQIKTDIALIHQKNDNQDVRIENFNVLVSEQIDLSRQILNELKDISIITNGQGIKINGLSSDFEEFKDDFKEFKKSIDK